MGDRTIVFDNHGDIQVQLRTHSQLDTTIYIACSRALARASPVLHAQIRQTPVPGTLELRNTLRDLAIQINGNDHDSLTIFLNIAHAHFLAVPRALSIVQLYNLTVLTTCYNCTSLLAPWVGSWIAGIQSAVRKCDISMMLWVFWELDFREDFRKMARRVVVELDAPEFAKGGRVLGSFIDSIAQTRLQSLQALLDVAHDMLEKLLVLEESPRWSRFVTQLGPRCCRQATSALLKSSLITAGLWPLPAAIDVQESVAEVYSKLAAAISHDHMGCEFGLFWYKKIQDALDSKLGQIEKLHIDSPGAPAEIT